MAVPRCVSMPPVNYLEKEDYGKVPKYLKQVGLIQKQVTGLQHTYCAVLKVF